MEMLLKEIKCMIKKQFLFSIGICVLCFISCSKSSNSSDSLPNGSLTIDGTTTEVNTLTATVTDEDGISENITYQWYRSDDDELSVNADEAISLATMQTYTLVSDDIRKYIFVTVVYEDDESMYENIESDASDVIAIATYSGATWEEVTSSLLFLVDFNIK